MLDKGVRSLWSVEPFFSGLKLTQASGFLKVKLRMSIPDSGMIIKTCSPCDDFSYPWAGIWLMINGFNQDPVILPVNNTCLLIPLSFSYFPTSLGASNGFQFTDTTFYLVLGCIKFVSMTLWNGLAASLYGELLLNC
jgi:hypothetical protein